jgi:DNA-binding transcriptional LysR family regulator
MRHRASTPRLRGMTDNPLRAWTALGSTPSVELMDSAIEVRQLRAFVALVEQGSVTGAARALDLAQSTVSEALSSLERAMGTPMFLRRRGSHELLLTDAGEALLPHAHRVLGAIDDAHVAVAHATTGARGRVIIATNESISSYVLAPSLDCLRPAWPNTTFAVTVTNCRDIREGVETGAYDIGLTLYETCGRAVAPVAHADVTEIASDVPLVVFARSTHPLAAAVGGVRREALASYSVFITDPAGDYYDLIRNFIEADGMPGPRLEATGSVESVKRAVLADTSVLGVLPAYALAEELRSGRFVLLDVRPAPPVLGVTAMVSRARPPHPVSHALVDAVRESYRAVSSGGKAQ